MKIRGLSTFYPNQFIPSFLLGITLVVMVYLFYPACAFKAMARYAEALARRAGKHPSPYKLRRASKKSPERRFFDL